MRDNMTKIKRKDIDDSSSFYKVAKVQTNYQSELTSDNAGSNITITKVNGVTKINATGGGGGGTSYTAGEGIDITNNVISNTSIPDVDKTYVDSGLAEKQDTLTAGQNITITDNTVSVSPIISQNTGNMEFISQVDGTSQGLQRVIGTMYDQRHSKMMPTDVIMDSNFGTKAGIYYTYDATNHVTELAMADDESGDPTGRISPTSLNADSQQIPNCAWVNDKVAQQVSGKSTVSVSATGTATDEVSYITVDGVEKKIAGGSGGGTPEKVETSVVTSTADLKPVVLCKDETAGDSIGIADMALDYNLGHLVKTLAIGRFDGTSPDETTDMKSGVTLWSTEYQGNELTQLEYQGQYGNTNGYLTEGNGIPPEKWVQGAIKSRVPNTNQAGKFLVSTSTPGVCQWFDKWRVTGDFQQRLTYYGNNTLHISVMDDNVSGLTISPDYKSVRLVARRDGSKYCSLDLTDTGLAIESRHVSYTPIPLPSAMTDLSNDYVSSDGVDKMRSNIALCGWVKELMPSQTITGDATTTAFTVSHSLGKKPSIVQVTKDSDGVVVNDVTIAKTNNSVVVTFTTAPAEGETYTVGMLY